MDLFNKVHFNNQTEQIYTEQSKVNRSDESNLEPTGDLLGLQVPPLVNVGLDPAPALLGGASLVPGHALDLLAQDPASLRLDLLFRDLRH